MKAVITTADLHNLPDNSDFPIPQGALITPSARDQAVLRHIRFVEVSSLPPTSPDHVVALGSDHGGYRLKEALKPIFTDLRLEIHDVGVHDEQPADYPDIAQAVAEAVATGAASRGVIVDGAGIGSAMAANKVPGIRAALCYDQASARNSREHNDANILTLGGRLLTESQAREVLHTWLSTPFAGGRHANRVAKITELERRYRT